METLQKTNNEIVKSIDDTEIIQYKIFKCKKNNRVFYLDNIVSYEENENFIRFYFLDSSILEIEKENVEIFSEYKEKDLTNKVLIYFSRELENVYKILEFKDVDMVKVIFNDKKTKTISSVYYSLEDKVLEHKLVIQKQRNDVFKIKENIIDIIYPDKNNGKYLITYKNNKKIEYESDELIVNNLEEIIFKEERFLYFQDNQISNVKKVYRNDKYIRIIKNDNTTNTYKESDIIIKKQESTNRRIEYLTNVAILKTENVNSKEDEKIVDSLIKLNGRVNALNASLLYKYLNNSEMQQEDLKYKLLAFPFNIQSKKIVDSSFNNEVTLSRNTETINQETILNIIYNSLYNDESVLIVSSDVKKQKEIYKKMQDEGFNFLICNFLTPDDQRDFFNSKNVVTTYDQKLIEDFKLKFKRDFSEYNLNDQDFIEKEKLDNKFISCFERFKESSIRLDDLYNDAKFDEIIKKQKENYENKEKLEKLKAYIDKRVLSKIAYYNFNNKENFDYYIKKVKKDFKGKTSLNLVKFKQLINQDKFYKYITPDYLYTYKDQILVALEYEKIRNQIKLNKEDIKILEGDTDSVLVNKTIKMSRALLDYHIYKKMILANQEQDKYKFFNKLKLEKEQDEFDSKDPIKKENGYKLVGFQQSKEIFDKFIKKFPVIFTTPLNLDNCLNNEYIFDNIIIYEDLEIDILESVIMFARAKKATVIFVNKEDNVNKVLDAKIDKLFRVSNAPLFYDGRKSLEESADLNWKVKAIID